MAHRLTREQRVRAVKLYYQNQCNGAATARLLREEFGIRLVQSRNITSLIRKFEATGSVHDAKRSGRRVSATTEEKAAELRASLLRSPQKSSKCLSGELGISDRSVRRLLDKMKMKPYIPRLLHSLHDGDSDRRVEFCERFLAKLREDENFPTKIWWSDEATFKLNGHINRHNCVYWNEVNPHVILEKDINLPGVTVWAAISVMGIIGPVFFDGPVNQNNYLHVLQTELWPRVEHDFGVYFQQDGTPPHYALCVREWLDVHFEGRWIGRRGPLEWPDGSPDLTPPDFFLWGVLKDLVYKTEPRNIDELKDRIQDKFADITIELCRKACLSVVGRVRECLAQDGQQFEHFT
ncbi:uncharacterized protein LOC129087027 [Pteronotus mesoamericanus]|uniref:uncharacterized protein LOC129087027 n=1 Tax=Pteronotus mesoamericanus TaxID=1884717 RepID=UPI0023EADBD3|nr:uncharacterized protein LOC129087027 [Pteronotus parnellii mesoamericanus]